MAARKRERGSEGPPTTKKQDIEAVERLFEAFLDELAIFRGLDPRSDRMLKQRCQDIDTKLIGTVRAHLSAGRFQCAKKELSRVLGLVDGAVIWRSEAREEEGLFLADGTDVTWRNRVVETWWDEKVRRMGHRYAISQDEMPRGRDGYVNNEDGSYGRMPAQPDETVVGADEVIRRPVTLPPLDARLLKGIGEASSALASRLKESVRKHGPDKPVYLELLEAIAGKGPMKLWDICKVAYDQRLIRNGYPNSTGRCSPQYIYDELRRVDNPIQGDGNGRNSIWEIPKDFVFKEGFRDPRSPKVDPRSTATTARPKRKTRKELREAQEGLISLARVAITLVPEGTKVRPFYRPRRGEERAELGIEIAVLLGKSSAFNRAYSDFRDAASKHSEGTVIRALQQGWPDARASWVRHDTERRSQRIHEISEAFAAPNLSGLSTARSIPDDRPRRLEDIIKSVLIAQGSTSDEPWYP